MATYQELRGMRVKYLSADPTNPITGQVWYNTATATLKSLVGVAAWSSGGSYFQKTGNGATGGPQTAAICAGGDVGSGPTRAGTYDGAAWTVTSDMTTGRANCAGAKDGSQTAFWAAGGATTLNTTEEYDGSSWTAGGTLVDGRRLSGTAGTLTTGLAFGGWTPGKTTNSEQYNGTAWTATPSLGTSTYYNAGLGTQTAAISYGGNAAPPDTGINNTETYDGSSWTALPVGNYARQQAGAHGNTSDGYVYGGSAGPSNRYDTNDHWDGSSWTTSPATLFSPLTVWNGTGPGGPAGMTVGGYGPAYPAGTAVTSLFNISTTTVNPATWASGGNLGTARSYIAGCGTQTAALAVAGYSSGVLANVEEYNGTAWSEENNLGTTRYSVSRGMGTQTAGLFAGGEAPGATSTASELYNGASWTATPSLTGAISYASGFGTSTAALICGGANPRSVAVTTNNSYDGSSWTANPATPFNDKEGATSGPSTAGIFAGGLTPGGSGQRSTSYEINTTTWTAGPSLGVARYGSGFGGGTATQSAAWVASGQSPPYVGSTEHYDGTSWSTSAAVTTARGKSGGAGTQDTALFFGGDAPPPSNATEEFSVGTTTAKSASTITTT